jgi:hypothetical protein
MRWKLLSRSLLASATAALALWLCACSSKGDDLPAPPGGVGISPANAMRLAGAVGAVGALLDLSTQPADLLGHGGKALAGGLGETVDCPEGGTATTEHLPGPSKGDPTGSIYNVFYDDCGVDGSILNGGWGIAVESFDGESDPVQIAITYWIDDLSVESPGPDGPETWFQQGTLSEVLQIGSEPPYLGLELTGTFFAHLTRGASTTVYSLTGILIQAELDFAGSTATAAWNLEFTIDDAPISFVMTTVVPFNFPLGDKKVDGPISGLLTITAGSDTLYMHALGDGASVLLEIDQGTDGSIEWSEVVLWDDL